MVAILEDDQVAEIFVERERQRGVVGNVYKGRVSKVLPGMQSSFIDIGLERDGFLYVAGRRSTRMRGVRDTAADATATTTRRSRSTAGETARSGPRQAANAGRDDRDATSPAKIEELLKEGQEILVQVVKEPLGTKGARLTSHVTMPGRFLVFMPTVDHVGISRKIESREERIAAARHRPRVPRAARLHRRRHHPHRRRAAAPRKTSSATWSTSTRSGSRCARRWSRGARRRCVYQEQSLVAQAAARPADRRLPGDPHRQRDRSTGACSSWSSGSCRPRAAGEAATRRNFRSSRSTASRPRSTRRCAARCG